ncbi:MAG: hypothetical protein ACI9BW_002683 [Gammaproteobacteria bacterium]|jgi:hypothetical protein
MLIKEITRQELKGELGNYRDISVQATAADANRLTRASGVREIMLVNATNDELRNNVINAWGLTAHYEKMADAFDIAFDDAARSDFRNNAYSWLHWGQFSSTTDPKDLEKLKNAVRAYSIPALHYSWGNSVCSPLRLDPDSVKFVDAAQMEVSGEYYPDLSSQGLQPDA